MGSPFAIELRLLHALTLCRSIAIVAPAIALLVIAAGDSSMRATRRRAYAIWQAVLLVHPLHALLRVPCTREGCASNTWKTVNALRCLCDVADHL